MCIEPVFGEPSAIRLQGDFGHRCPRRHLAENGKPNGKPVDTESCGRSSDALTSHSKDPAGNCAHSPGYPSTCGDVSNHDVVNKDQSGLVERNWLRAVIFSEYRPRGTCTESSTGPRRVVTICSRWSSERIPLGIS
jgi:hypothetical protein